MCRFGLRGFALWKLAVLLLFTTSLAGAQVTTTALRGLVKDPSGAVIPGVALSLKDAATGIEKTSISGEDGSYLFPNLSQGVYRLTAVMPGFKTAAYDSIVVSAGRTTDLTVSLAIGAVSTTVEVTTAAAQLETTSNTISTTIRNTSIQNLPYSGRDTLNFALFTPGAMSAGSDRNSTFDGLPNASLNITIDGMNNNSQRFKSGGTSFFQFAPARLDAMEEVTVTTSGMGAESSGQGAMQIQFVTKRGTDKYHFRVLEQFHNEWLNANSHMNKLRGIPKTKTRQNFAVGSVGGPALPFLHYFKDKLFFFAYLEANPQPGTSTQSNTMVQPEVLAGNYTFLATDGTRKTLNALDIARQNGFPSAIDPTTKGMLDRVMATTSTPGVTFEPVQAYPFEQTMRWPYSFYTRHYYPTVRLDYQPTEKVAWHGSWNYRNSYFTGTPPYPGDDAAQYSWAGDNKTDTWALSNTVDWTISPNMVNSFTFGNQMNWELFYSGFDIHQWSSLGDRRINLPFVSAFIPNFPTDDRNNPVWEWKDSLNWVKGRHTLRLGGSVLHTSFWSQYHGNYSGVLNYNLGVRTDDPVYNVLRNAIIGAGASTNTNDIGNFMSIYAMLTGRLTGISGTANVNPDTLNFEKFAPIPSYFGFTTVGLYAQDSFRWTPHFTLNYGLRWQLDGAIHGTVPIYASPSDGSFWGPSTGNFHPGELGGNLNPAFIQDSSPYRHDFVNPAPNVGFAWNPMVEGGFLRKLLGNDKTVIRSSFGLTFYNEGLNSFSNYITGNPGSTQSINATANIDFAPGQLFLSGPEPTFSTNPSSFSFPIPLSRFVLNGGTSINAFNPDMKSPYTTNWMFGIQRELAKGLILDVRYVGNKSTHMWHQQNLNEINTVENGFLQEFVNARNNLAINQAAGVQSFANRGLPGQVPLPIFEAAFGANGSQPALSNGSGFGNTSYIQTISFGAAGSMAGTLGSTTGPSLYCRLVGANFAPCASLGYTTATAFPMNFFKANPYANNLNYQDSNGDNNYNALQIQLTRSLGRGLMGNVAYTWGHGIGDQSNVTGQGAESTWTTLRDAHLSYADTPFDHRHSVIGYWTYDLPFGNGRRLSTSSRLLDRLVSNWTLGGIHRFISGAPLYLTGGRATFNNVADGGVIFGNGLTADQLIQRLDTVVGGYDSACQCFHTDVASLQLANGAVDPNYFRPGDVPGMIGYRTMYRGKWTYQFDLSLNKEFRLTERVNMGFKAVALNFLNHPWRTGYGNTTTTGTTFGQMSSFAGPRNIQIRAYIDF